MKCLTTSIALYLGLLSASGANAALVSELSGQAVYDTDLNVTWLANANLAAANTFGLATGVNLGTDSFGFQSIINSNGSMTWGGAQRWIAAMNAANYLGYSDWRLPITLQPDATCTLFGSNCSGSEMGHLNYIEQLGFGASIITNPPLMIIAFQNLQLASYWSGTELAIDSKYAWDFNFGTGNQYADSKSYNFFAMAVRTGDVAAVPIPAAAWLLGSGLLGLAGIARKRKQLN